MKKIPWYDTQHTQIVSRAQPGYHFATSCLQHCQSSFFLRFALILQLQISMFLQNSIFQPRGLKATAQGLFWGTMGRVILHRQSNVPIYRKASI